MYIHRYIDPHARLHAVVISSLKSQDSSKILLHEYINLKLLALESRMECQIRSLHSVHNRHTSIIPPLNRARSHDWSGNVAVASSLAVGLVGW